MARTDELRDEFFNDVRDIMKWNFLWFDQPNTIYGKMVKFYSFFRLFASFMMILVAVSQIYFYGMSYVLHDSVALVPLGVIGLPVNLHTCINFKAIVETATKYRVLIDSFPDEERAVINQELSDNKRKTHIIVKALNYYVIGTVFTHLASISSHYYFGIPQKPVVLPLLYEKFLDGHLELSPMLVFVVVLSLEYIILLLSFSGYLAVSLYVMKAPVGIMKALTHRLTLITKKAGKSSEKLRKSMKLEDTIKKHGNLLDVCHDMMSWNAFPLAFASNLCTILFCLNALTFLQSIHKNEFSSAGIWGSFLIFCCVTLYVICSQGQEVELESEELLSAIYGLPWYRDSPKERRAIVLMIAQGNRLIKMNYKGTTDINMVKYSDVVQTAYSYFMILSSVM